MRKIKNKIDVGVVTTEPFPYGMAATQRLISSKKILAKHHKMKIYIVMSSDYANNVVNTQVEGVHQNIHFLYTTKTTIWPYEKSVIHKLIIYLRGFFNLIICLINDRPKTIIVYTSRYLHRITALIISKIFNIRILIEEDEYPKVLKNTTAKFYRNLQLKIYKRCDGMIVMTQELHNYYSSLGCKDIFILPMTVDVDRFSHVQNNDSESNYFVYLGGGGGFERDGVLSTIKGFHLFSQRYPDYKFIIAGPLENNQDIYQKLLNYIKKHNIKNIEFKGRVNSDKVPELLANSVAIVMTPQENYPSGGFPTKLGEFMMSAKPVILTDVSDISLYMNHTNSFLIKPNDDNLIANAMCEIIEDIPSANRKGIEGRHTAQKVFNVATHEDEMESFIFYKTQKTK